MIEEILKEIADAEVLAEEKRKDAFQKGKGIVLEAEARADRMKREAVEQCKADGKAAIAAAEEQARARRAAILAEGEEAAAALVASKKEQTEKAADEILAAFVGKYS